MNEFDPQETEAYRSNERLTVWVCHLMVVLMMACVGVSFMQVGQAFVLNWKGAYLPFIVAFISLESLYSWRTTRRQFDLNLNGLIYFLIEVVVLLSVTKIVLIIWNGWQGYWPDFSTWSVNFFPNFFDGEYIFVILVGTMIWFVSRLFAMDLSELEGDHALLGSDILQHVRSDRMKARQVMISRVLTIGLFMVLIASLVRLDHEALWGDRPAPSGSVLNVVIYFVLALVFLTQTHLAALRASWAWERVPIRYGLAQRWWITSLIFLGMVGIAAFLLPTNYSIGFLSSLGYLVSLTGYIISTMVTLVLLPIYLLISWLISLFSARTADSPSPLESMPDMLPPPGIGMDLSWLDLLKSLFFWGVFSGVIGYAFYQYILQNKELIGRITELPGLHWLVNQIRRLLNGAKSANQKIRLAVHKGIERLRDRRLEYSSTASTHYFSLRKLPPREKVIFFYLAFLRRSKESGFPRRPSETPYEYAASLESHLMSRKKNYSLSLAHF
jgi:hypothetical protein